MISIVFAIAVVVVGAVLFCFLNTSVPSENGGNNEHDDEVSPSPTPSPIPTPSPTPSPQPSPFVSASFSFEEDMQGWEARAIDLELANFTIDWSIERSQEMAKNGNSALKFYLENWNDMGKIWIERYFIVEPNTRYLVDVSYSFASADWGDANLFRIITGVLHEPPKSRNELVYQDYTGNGADSDVGFLWLNKNYSFTVESDFTGRLYVVIGVWGIWETPRTYYLDNVEITFRQRARAHGPWAVFTYSPPSPLVNESVVFDASASVPGWNGTHKVSIANYTWDFGDGTSPVTETDPVTTHNYTAVGPYTVNLTVVCQDDPVLIAQGLTSSPVTVEDVQVIPEFPTWTPMLFIFIVITVAIAIYKRKLIKPPN